MPFSCFSCGAEITLPAGSVPGRRDCCEACGADLHVCRNCKHHDLRAYNECRESQADRVLEKERANFCDMFAFIEGKRAGGGDSKRASAKRKLDDLFSK